jgi:cytoskeletal protein CcmA (bactofilin family)
MTGTKSRSVFSFLFLFFWAACASAQPGVATQPVAPKAGPGVHAQPVAKQAAVPESTGKKPDSLGTSAVDSLTFKLADSLAKISAVLAGQPSQAVEQGPLDKDVMVAGGVVRVMTPVEGDLFIAGGEAAVSTSVRGDVWATGALVSFDGTAEGDVRAAGYQVTLKGIIKSNAVVYARTLSQEPESHVWGDLKFSGEKARIGGVVDGVLRADAQTVRIDGNLKGGANVNAERVIVGSGALVQGDLIYKSENEVVVSQGAKILGSVVHNVPEGEGAKGAKSSRGGWFGFIGGMKLIWFVGMLVVGLLLSVFVPDLLGRTNEVLHTSPFLSLLAGFVLFACAPVVLAILVVTVVGWPLGLLVTFVYVLGFLFSGIFAGHTVGKLILHRVEKAQESTFWPMALGILILVIASSIPMVGFLVRALLVMFGFGALAVSFWHGFKQRASGKVH